MPQGKSLLLSITRYINYNRYSTKKGGPDVYPSNEKIAKLFTITPPIDISKGNNHLERSKEITVSRGGRLGLPYLFIKTRMKYQCLHSKHTELHNQLLAYQLIVR